jgi:hypothetical protein
VKKKKTETEGRIIEENKKEESLSPEKKQDPSPMLQT